MADRADAASPPVTTELFGGAPTAAPAQYAVLARKYRPQTFDQLIGQEALVTTLGNAFAAGRIAHAFLLTGVRGIGKTTTARIIAKALNCVGPDGQGGPTIRPCGVCENCRAIAEDRHVDVLEIDAASHTGVDNIREILDGVRYRPVLGRTKVYIIDEVHMLSKGAFNALLKTLEEPPSHVKFVLATTETRKVPVTVLSRCQRFDLRRLDSGPLAEHLGRVAAAEGAAIEPEALRLLARAADGSVRDALSLLDQAIAHGAGRVGAASVSAMLGLADGGRLYDLADLVFRGQAAPALGQLRALYDAGAEPLSLLQDWLDLVHALTRRLLVPEEADAAAVSEDERNRARAMAAGLTVPVLTRAWQILLKGIAEVQAAPSPIDAAEMVLVRLCYAAELPTPADLVARLERRPLTTDTAPASAAPAAAPANPPASTPEPASFAALVALFGDKREPRLKSELSHNVEPVAFAPGRLTLRLRPHAPRDLPGRVQELLRAWLGPHWQVVLDESPPSGPSLAEQERQRQAERNAAAAEHPTVKAAIETFPGAVIARVRPLPEAPPPAAGDDWDGETEASA